LCDKFRHSRFEPSGITNNPDIPIAKSITDYIFRWLALKFLPAEGAGDSPLHSGVDDASGAGKLWGPEADTENPEEGAASRSRNEAAGAHQGGDPASSSSPEGLYASSFPGHGPAAAVGGNGGSKARAAIEQHEKRVYASMADAPPCHECGQIMVRNGACYACINCGSTSGCS
jgi:ribonucleoside-diphosphate reductase alpha chain